MSLLVADGKGNALIDGVKIIDLGLRSKNRLWRIIHSNLLLRRNLNKESADIFHFHDPELIPFFLSFKKKNPKKKIVFDIHENFAEKLSGGRDWIPKIFRQGFRSLYLNLESKAKKRFDLFVGAIDRIVASFPSERSISLHNYPELSFFSAYQQPSENKTIGKIVYTGGFTAHRGITQIIAALEFVKAPVELYVFGRVEDHILEKCSSLKGFDKVRQMGVVDQNEMLEHVYTSNIGLVCNQSEGGYQHAMPNKLFEYMACSVPVIASDFPHWRAIVEKNNAGINIDASDPREIAKAINDILIDRELNTIMGENARRTVESFYNWEVEFNKLLTGYRKLLSEKN